MSKIAASLERTKRAKTIINQAVEELESLQRETRNKESELQDKRAQTITHA
jgi:Skp family chaperone for outer membrane proteins